MSRYLICVWVFLLSVNYSQGDSSNAPPLTMSRVLANSQPSDWRALDPENTLYLEVQEGSVRLFSGTNTTFTTRVIIELAPNFAPRHVANVKALVREKYFDGLSILRCQDNYVVQWGDPDAEVPERKRKIQAASPTLPPEFDRTIDAKLPFVWLPDGDMYAPEVGFSDSFPVARDPRTGKVWLIHSYGMVGAGRDTSVDSGGGTELYVVIGQAPRQLDRNVTLLGRVLQGMELLSALPRGTAPMGFYEKAEHRVLIKSIRVAADVPPAERTPLEVMRTDRSAFQQLIESRRNRKEEWFALPAGRIDICNVPIPVRLKPSNPPSTQ